MSRPGAGVGVEREGRDRVFLLGREKEEKTCKVNYGSLFMELFCFAKCASKGAKSWVFRSWVKDP